MRALLCARPRLETAHRWVHRHGLHVEATPLTWSLPTALQLGISKGHSAVSVPVTCRLLSPGAEPAAAAGGSCTGSCRSGTRGGHSSRRRTLGPLAQQEMEDKPPPRLRVSCLDRKGVVPAAGPTRGPGEAPAVPERHCGCRLQRFRLSRTRKGRGLSQRQWSEADRPGHREGSLSPWGPSAVGLGAQRRPGDTQPPHPLMGTTPQLTV